MFSSTQKYNAAGYKIRCVLCVNFVFFVLLILEHKVHKPACRQAGNHKEHKGNF